MTKSIFFLLSVSNLPICYAGEAEVCPPLRLQGLGRNVVPYAPQKRIGLRSRYA